MKNPTLGLHEAVGPPKLEPRAEWGMTMDLANEWQVFLLGCSGGCINEFMHWWSLKTNPDFPEYARRVKYWIITGIMVLIGGGLAALYLGASVEALLALHIGLSAPLILQKLTTTAAAVQGARGGGPTIVNFFRW